MATSIFQMKIKDYAEWKKVYDSMESVRVSYGKVSNQVLRDAGDPNKVFVIIRWNSMENARKYSQSPELKAAMEKAGVEGPPVINIFNEA